MKNYKITREQYSVTVAAKRMPLAIQLTGRNGEFEELIFRNA